jgi:hypothetical protein
MSCMARDLAGAVEEAKSQDGIASRVAIANVVVAVVGLAVVA